MYQLFLIGFMLQSYLTIQLIKSDAMNTRNAKIMECAFRKANVFYCYAILYTLMIAHSMKEQFRLFWQCKTKPEGARFLGWWIIQAVESGVEQLAKTART